MLMATLTEAVWLKGWLADLYEVSYASFEIFEDNRGCRIQEVEAYRYQASFYKGIYRMWVS